MKKWSKRIALLFFCLLLLLAGTGWFLLGSQGGTNFIVSQLERQLDGQLKIASVQGRILDRLELTDVVFDSPVGKAKLGHLVFDWKTTDLFRLHLHIKEISANDLSYNMIHGQPETELEEPAEPFTLPDLTLPVKITLEKLVVTNVVFMADADAQPMTVDDVSLSLVWNKSGIKLQNLSVAMPQGKLQTRGQLNPTGSYPLQLQTDLQITAADLPSVKLHGDYSGDLHNLQIKMVVSEDIKADLDLTVTELIDNPAWDGVFLITELYPRVFSPEAPGLLTGKLQSKGDQKQAAITGSLALRDDDLPELNWDASIDVLADLESMLVTVHNLVMEQEDAKARLELAGTVDGEQNLNLQLNWQDLQWPVAGQADFEAKKGNVAVTGSVDNYQLTLQADVAGTALPPGSWSLEAKGSTEQAEILQLTGETLDGKLSVQGDVQWTPRVEWQLTTVGENINPGKVSVDWPGQLGWLIKTSGKLVEEEVHATVFLDKLQGTLRQLPIGGSGNLEVRPDVIQIKELQLSSGKARFSASGSLGNNSEIDWNVRVPDFSDLLPDSSGSFTGQGTVKGEIKQPQVTMQASAVSVVIPPLELQKLQADMSVDLSWEKPFQLQVTALGLQSGENLIRQLELSGNGTLDKHSLVLSASHDLAGLSLALQGGYIQEQWQGMLNLFKIDGSDVGTWQLAAPTKVTGGATAASMAGMCLARETSSLCLDGSWNKNSNKSTANVDFNGFNLAWLAPWFPDTLKSLDGLFSLKASVAMQEKIKASVTAEITPGTLVYLTDTEVTGTVAHEGGKLDLLVADDGVTTDFRFSLDGNVIKGNARLPDVLQVEKTGDAGIEAELVVDVDNFDVVEALVSDVQNLNAAIDMNFKVDGSLQDPNVLGKGELQIINVLIPVAGLELKDTTINILAADKEIIINGKFNSPSGSLALDGKAVLDAEQNWPARVTLKADKFRLINLPEARVFLTSDLLLEKKAETISLTGKLIIPKADVLIRQLARGSETVSPDVVIIQEQQEKIPEARSPFEMNLRVALGNNVHFVGFGLNAFINGQLTLTAKPEQQMLGSGEFHIKQGTYRAYGQDLDIVRGIIYFPGGPLTQPGINLQATRTVGQVVAGINAIGPARKPKLTTFSRPPMSESSTISYLLTGTAPESGSGGAKLSIGRQINNKLSVSVGTDVKTGDSEFIARYRLNRKIYIQTTTATNSNAVDLFYTIEVGGVKELVDEVLKKDLRILPVKDRK